MNKGNTEIKERLLFNYSAFEINNSALTAEINSEFNNGGAKKIEVLVNITKVLLL
jgi:hypothetical protein